MCLHYLGKFEVSDWAVSAIIKCIFEWLTEWQPTVAWLAVIVSHKSHTYHITSSLLEYVLKMSTSSTNASAYTLCHSPTAHSIRVTHSGPLAVDALFQFVDVWDLGTIDLLLINVKEITDFQWFSGLKMIFWASMRYPAWIRCCKRPNYNFCISQGSVATELRLDGQNWGRLCHVPLRCCVPKTIKFGQCFTELFTK